MKRYTAHEDDFELNELVGRSYKLIVGSEQLLCEAINGGVSFFGPQAHAPGHVHETEEEVAYCLEGTGQAVIDGKAETIRPGTFIVFPPKVLHSINNTGDKTIKLLYLFSPKCKIGQYSNVPSS
ncbi:MAG: cupin domain-containing protein [Actinobacteria bacterium]|nr:cupin domain-containing protein [Actinomycetota bacterium]